MMFPNRSQTAQSNICIEMLKNFAEEICQVQIAKQTLRQDIATQIYQ